MHESTVLPKRLSYLPIFGRALKSPISLPTRLWRIWATRSIERHRYSVFTEPSDCKVLSLNEKSLSTLIILLDHSPAFSSQSGRSLQFVCCTIRRPSFLQETVRPLLDSNPEQEPEGESKWKSGRESRPVSDTVAHAHCRSWYECT